MIIYELLVFISKKALQTSSTDNTDLLFRLNVNEYGKWKIDIDYSKKIFRF